MKKKHWTQTPEGKAKLKQIRGGKLDEAADSPDIAYALGYIKGWLATYSERSSIPEATLAYRVGKLLQRTANR